MTDEVKTTENVFEAKAREIISEFKSEEISRAFPEYYPGLIRAIASALREAVEAEREACAVKFDEYYQAYVGIDEKRAAAGKDAAAAIRAAAFLKEVKGEFARGN